MSSNSSSPLPKESSDSNKDDSDDEKSSSSASSVIKIDSNCHKSASGSSLSTDSTVKSVGNRQIDDGNLSDIEDEGENLENVQHLLRPVAAPRRLTNPEHLVGHKSSSVGVENGEKEEKVESPENSQNSNELPELPKNDSFSDNNSLKNDEEVAPIENRQNSNNHYECVPEFSDRSSIHTNPQLASDEGIEKCVENGDLHQSNSNKHYDEVPGNHIDYGNEMKNEEGWETVHLNEPIQHQIQTNQNTQNPNDEYGEIKKKSTKQRRTFSIGQNSKKIGFEPENKPMNWKKSINGLDNVEFTEAENNDDESKGAYKQSGFEKWVNILLCRSDLTEEDFESKPVSFIELFKYGSARDKRMILLGILFSILSGIGQPLPLLMGGLLANVMIGYAGDRTEENRELLWSRGYLLLGINGALGVVMVFTTFAQYFFLRLACQNITMTLRSKFIESILRQDSAWFDKQRFGSINSQLNERIDCIKDGIAEKIGLLVRGLTAFVGTLTVAFIFNWQVTLMMLPVAPLSCLSMSFMARLTSKAARKQAQWFEKSANVLQESIINVRTVQSCNGQNQMVDKYKAILKKGRIYGKSLLHSYKTYPITIF